MKYVLIKYIKSVLWKVAKRLSYIEEARCLKVKPRERAFKQFKSPVLNVLILADRYVAYVQTHTHSMHYERFVLATVSIRCRPAAARLQGLRVRIAPEKWMSVCLECCVLSCRGLCEGPITRPEERYQVWCV